MQFNNLIKDYIYFSAAERNYYETFDGNRVGLTLEQVFRYIRFVEIAWSRYQVVNEEVVKAFRTKMKECRSNSGTRKLTQQEISELEIESKHYTTLHFEIESFILFAKVLMDKIAHCIEDFFGKASGASLRSHNKWCKNLDKFSQAKSLEISNDMKKNMTELRSIVANYRDKQIAHFQNPRAIHATRITADGKTQIDTTALYPKESDKSSTSPIVDEVAELIENYIYQFIELVKQNRSKNRFKVRPISGETT